MSNNQKNLFLLLGLGILSLLILAGCKSSSKNNPEPNPTLIIDHTPPAATLTPAPNEKEIIVSNVTELKNAVAQANQRGNCTIFLKDGTYQLSGMLWISGNSITFKSLSGKRDLVTLKGDKMAKDAKVTHIFNVVGKNFAVYDLTLGEVGCHLIQIHGENDADNLHVRNVRFYNAYQQFLKGSIADNSTVYNDHGIIENCLFEFTSGYAPNYYTGGIDIHRGNNWIVRNNIFMVLELKLVG